MLRRVRIASMWALGAFLLGFSLFVHLYMQQAQPFDPQAGSTPSFAALILGLPIGALSATIVFAVVFAVIDLLDRV